MTSREIVLVQESFSKLAPIADQAAALFFVRLFELDPSLRRQCRGEREQQGRRLVRLLASSICRLEQLDRLRPSLQRLGRRQAARGTREEHYAFSGAALLWTLEKALGPEFTPVLKSAWTQFYVVLANAMLDGAHRHELAA